MRGDREGVGRDSALAAALVERHPRALIDAAARASVHAVEQLAHIGYDGAPRGRVRGEAGRCANCCSSLAPIPRSGIPPTTQPRRIGRDTPTTTSSPPGSSAVDFAAAKWSGGLVRSTLFVTAWAALAGLVGVAPAAGEQDGAWTAPVTVGASGTFPGRPSVGFGADGSALVAWVPRDDEDDANAASLVLTLAPGGRAGATRRVSGRLLEPPAIFGRRGVAFLRGRNVSPDPLRAGDARVSVAFGTTHGVKSLHSGMRVTVHMWTSYPADGVRYFATFEAAQA